jgi:hypothetical protein
MTTTMHTTTGTDTTTPALTKVETSFKAYVVLSTTALALVAATAVNGHAVNTFMWVRGALLPIIAVLLYRLTIAASRGNHKAFDRVRTLTLIVPIAVIAVDLIPGVCPLWYAGLQALCMIPVIVAAVITRGPALRAVFPQAR